MRFLKVCMGMAIFTGTTRCPGMFSQGSIVSCFTLLMCHSYHCKDNTVTQCNSIPECTVVEICQDGCTEHNRQPGLHGAGCGTMRIWEGDDKPAPALTKRNDPSTGYDNDGTFIYVCNAKNEIEECTDFAPSKCIVKESCPRGCFQKPNGALCVDRSLPPVPRHVPSPATAEDKSSIDQSTADDCGNGSTKCKKCTSDWRGVLTCQYGFCYVVPGDWCPADKICRESCNCCRKFKKFGKRDAMPLLEGPAGTPPSSDKDATPSKTPAPHDPAPVSDMVPTPTNTTARCIPGHYYCTKAGKPDILLVCTLQQFFRVSATCAKDSSCYEGLERGTAYCGLPPKQAAPGLEVRTDTSSLDGTLSSHHAKMEASKTVDAPAKRQILSPVPIPSGGVCPPGIYACGTADYDNIDDGSAIFVCNTSGQWIFAAKCCGVNTCVTDWSHGTAHCTC